MVSAGYVALGDSITAYRNNVKVYFECLLDDIDELPVTEMVNSGVGGWNTADVLTNLHEKCLAYRPAIVTVMLGTNDHAIYEGHTEPAVSLDSYTGNLLNIVRNIRTTSHGGSFNNGIPYAILMTPPYVSTYTNSAGTHTSQERLKRYCDKVKEVSGELETGFIDVNSITAEETEYNDQLYYEKFTADQDGVHLNTFGHSIIFPHIKRSIIRTMRP